MSLPIEKQYYTMKTSQLGINLIKRWEGLRLKTYLCPSGIRTIGYGHTYKVYDNQVITEAEAEDYLKQDLKWAEDATNSYFNMINQYQFDALVSITYNMGAPKFRRTDLCRSIKYNPFSSAIEKIWKDTAIRNSKGEVLNGLINRRNDEVKLYFKE